METEFENTLACLSGAQIGLNHEKKWRLTATDMNDQEINSFSEYVLTL